ncbi:hypothetical protein GC174_08815 [bacterium]|nr:hypothetical protein [bacterium]
MLQRFARRTFKIQLVIWAVLALCAAWIAAVLLCLTKTLEALFALVSSQQFSWLPLIAFGAIIFSTSFVLEYAALKTPTGKCRLPKMSYAEIMVHSMMLLGGLGLILGALK